MKEYVSLKVTRNSHIQRFLLSALNTPLLFILLFSYQHVANAQDIPTQTIPEVSPQLDTPPPQVPLILDPIPEFQGAEAEIERLQQELEEVQQDLENELNRQDTIQQQLDSTQEELLAERSLREEAQRQLENIQEELLVERGLQEEPQSQLDSTQEELLTERSSQEDAQRQLENTQEELLTERSSQEDAQRQLENTQEELERTRQTLENTEASLEVAESTIEDLREGENLNQDVMVGWLYLLLAIASVLIVILSYSQYRQRGDKAQRNVPSVLLAPKADAGVQKLNSNALTFDEFNFHVESKTDSGRQVVRSRNAIILRRED